jgi:LCP family protein required for cell wall assembly
MNKNNVRDDHIKGNGRSIPFRSNDEEFIVPARFVEKHTQASDIPFRKPGFGEKDDVQETLGMLSIDDETTDGKSSKKLRKEPGKKRGFRKRYVLVPLLILLILALAIAGYLFIRSNDIFSKVFGGNIISSLIDPGTPLKTDSEGRTNILLFGTSQDDTAHQNASGGGGLWLTDSIELMSIDQKTKTVKLVGIPRDLWVAVETCEVGDYAKINAVYECGAGLLNSSSTTGANYPTQDLDGAEHLMSVVQEVTGITPQYYIHADYSVLQKAVDAVGGVDVNIVGDGASGIYDTNFDWDCPNGAYTCKNVYYPTNGTYHLDGTQALFLSRARADTGEYSYKDFGLAQGDFDRQANQQKVLIALEAKVKTASVLANPIALDGLIGAFGDNITTDITSGEVKSFVTLAKSISSKNIGQVSLVSSGNAVVTTSEISGQSVVVPTSGTYDFSSISDYLAKELSTNPAVSENATIAVYNASGTVGAAGNEQTALEATGLTVDTVGDAASADAGTGSYTLYDQSNGKMPKTLAELESTLKAKATTAALPADITSNDDFVIIIN